MQTTLSNEIRLQFEGHYLSSHYDTRMVGYVPQAEFNKLIQQTNDHLTEGLGWVRFYSVVLGLSIMALFAGFFSAIVCKDCIWLSAVAAVCIVISVIGRRYCIHDFVNVKNRALQAMVNSATSQFPQSAWRFTSMKFQSCMLCERTPSAEGHCMHCSHFPYTGYITVHCGLIIHQVQVPVAVPVYTPPPVVQTTQPMYNAVQPPSYSQYAPPPNPPSYNAYVAGTGATAYGGNGVAPAQVQIDVVVNSNAGGDGGGSGNGNTNSTQCSKCGTSNYNPDNAFCGKCGARF